MLRMDEFNKIRKEFYFKKKSIYQISQEYRRSWATVKNIVSMPEDKIETRGSREGRKSIVITVEVENRIREFLEYEDATRVPRKQRFTSAYIYKKLKEEGIYQGSSKRLRTIVRQMRIDRKQANQKCFLELDFEFGKCVQIDHGEVEVEIDGLRVIGYLFVASVPGTCLRYCQFYPIKSQEAWGHFHEQLAIFFGGVFSEYIYDNDSVLKNNKTRNPTDFCLELQLHYGFEAIFCNKASGWEKGSVELSVGFCRRNYLAGVQSFNSKEINHYLEERCLNEIANGTHYSSKKPLCELFDELKNKLLPHHPGKIWGRWTDAKVDRFQYVSYQSRNYSVPLQYVGSTVKIFVTANSIEIYDGHTLITSHERLFFKQHDSIILDHYLDQLLKKPRAVKHAKAITHHQFADHVLNLKHQLESKYDEIEFAKQFIEILLLQRTSSAEDFDVAIKLALSYGAISFQGVHSILKQLQLDQTNITIDCDYPTIDHHFLINKYAELEQKETQ